LTKYKILVSKTAQSQLNALDPKTKQRLKAGIQSIRESLPDGAVDEERKKLESGSQLSLIA